MKTMQEENKQIEADGKEIFLSKVIKAGKRIYYVDVKANRTGELYLSMTESKKVTSGTGDSQKVSFEKHKIFVYPEDFEEFMGGLKEAITYIEKQQGKAAPRPDYSQDIKLDLEF